MLCRKMESSQKLKADLDLLGTSEGKVNCHALGIS